MAAPLLVLGLETSCDETAAAVVDGDKRIRSNVVLSQLDDHRAYGGVVPEIAARAHVSHLDRLIRRALDEAGVGLGDLSAIAATAGPGLIGGVIVGLTTAKALALGAGKPLIGVNHLEGHALTPRLVADVPFPYLLLLVSGGHCQLLAVEGVGRYRRLGTTIDDAVGEAFDKTAKLLNLGYPGGPAVEATAKAGDPSRFTLPRPMIGRPGCDFSFSGLKTAVRDLAASLPKPLSDRDKADIAAAFQQVVGAVMVDRTRRALALMPAGAPLVVAGGVAANVHLRTRLEALAASHGTAFIAPPIRLCTDNAAMIAWAGLEHFRLGRSDPLDLKPRARWPLDAAAAAPGAKA
ncbi:tRNA (adenosine(37)-N6)-threonylcarbamoyltransferase complex transferase subunit TsaD [Oleomonas cavernae]|uniref:tRNA N6-adenosine threonylcarbamoyltransferase n=1 Tax=Oleomonas cavernae TaxID=2320859 RepID=A0A418WHV7_9PROT|nr:tRNA (adenosine(37)-N6)-threonylcarbamoyltransferase complex transferase subunit TsaD [Oleomonas cavernae]RJF89626.1 tRNA (adenosine(37)-N6)-threonylcarbamoyltransferase complex transferase subunit TsaD [Oleomonas cavernae]